MGASEGATMAVRQWLWRYAPAEVAGTVGALAAATGANAFGVAAATAYAGAIGEGLAFYAVILFRELRRSIGPRRQTLARLMVEFGPAEIADTIAVRPLAMYLGPLLIGHFAAGVLAGKIAADVVFYGLAIVGYELGKTDTALRRFLRAGQPTATHPGPRTVPRTQAPLHHPGQPNKPALARRLFGPPDLASIRAAVVAAKGAMPRRLRVGRRSVPARRSAQLRRRGLASPSVRRSVCR
jgi:hypothetical protein